MRYPGSHKHEKVMKLTAISVALVVFIFGWYLAYLKTHPISANPIQQPILADPVLESPDPTPTSMATLQLFNGATKVPLTGQSIVLLTSPDCETLPCPSSTPLVLTADAQGKVAVSQQALKQHMKIYATGFKLDTYFAFLDPAQPNLLTLYEPMEGTKIVYDITLESVPIGLTTVK